MPKTSKLKRIDRTSRKYCVKDLYEALSKEKKKAFIISSQIHDISRPSFSVYCNLLLTDQQDIPTQKLDVLAALLDVTPEFLKNFTITKNQKNGQVFQARK